MELNTFYRISQWLVSAGFLLLVIEWLAVRWIVPGLGTIGVPILFRAYPAASGAGGPESNGTSQVAGVRVRVSRAGRVLRFSSQPAWSFFVLQTPCPLKGSLTHDPGSRRFRFVGRLPIGFPLLVAGWMMPALESGDTELIVAGAVLFLACVGIEIFRAFAVAARLVAARSGVPPEAKP